MTAGGSPAVVHSANAQDTEIPPNKTECRRMLVAVDQAPEKGNSEARECGPNFQVEPNRDPNIPTPEALLLCSTGGSSDLREITKQTRLHQIFDLLEPGFGCARSADRSQLSKTR